MTDDVTFIQSYGSIPHLPIPAPDVALKQAGVYTLQTINGYVPKDPDHKHDEFTLQLDHNDITQDVPDEEQLHTTDIDYSSYWTDAYLDYICHEATAKSVKKRYTYYNNIIEQLIMYYLSTMHDTCTGIIV